MNEYVIKLDCSLLCNMHVFVEIITIVDTMNQIFILQCVFAGLTSPVVSTADIVSRGQAVLDAVQDTPSESHDDDDDDDEDDDDVDDEDEDGNKSADTMSSEKARHAITGRGVTLSMLMADGIIQHGSSTMSIDYLVSSWSVV